MNKKRFVVALGVLALTLSGCSFSMHASIREIKSEAGDYKIKFAGEEERDIEDRRDGDINVVDGDGETVANLVFWDSTLADYEQDIVEGVYETVEINDREYYHGTLDEEIPGYVSSNYYLSYLGDVGCDAAQVIFAPESEMEYIGFSGKKVKDGKDPLEEYDFNLSGGKKTDSKDETKDETKEETTEEDEEETKKETKSHSSGDSTVVEFPNGVKLTLDGLSLTEEEDETLIEGSNYAVEYSGDGGKYAFMYAAEFMDEEDINTFVQALGVNSSSDYDEEVTDTGTFLFVDDTIFGSVAFYCSENTYGTYVFMFAGDRNVDYKDLMHDLADQLVDQDSLIKTDQNFSFNIDEIAEDDTEYETEEETEEETYSYSYSEDEPVGEKYWIDPVGWEISYDCEFFTTYSNDDYYVQWNYEAEDYIVDYLSGEDDTFLYADDNDIVDTFDLKVYGETFHVISYESVDDDFSFCHYYILSDDGKKCAEFEGNTGGELANSEISGIIEVFLQK